MPRVRPTRLEAREGAIETAQAEAADSASLDANLPAHFGLITFLSKAGILSISTISNLVRAVITAKLLALTLGPSKVGILAQVLNFSAFLFQIIPLGLTTGVAKLVAEAPAQRSRVTAVVGTSAALAVASAATCLILLAPFSTQISQLLTGSPGYALPVLLILISLPLYNLASVLSYVLQGLADIRRLTIANVATAAGSLVVLIPATILFGLTGAIASVVVSGLLQSVFFGIAVWRAYRTRGWPLSATHLSRSTARSLLNYGGVLLIAGIGTWGSLLIVRTVGIHTLGEFQNGIYQVVNGVSAQYMAVFIGWMAAYVFPRVVAEPDAARLQTLINSALRANLLIMGTGLAATVALRGLVVRLLYSPAFITAAPILPIQVMGDYARVIGWSFGICLFAHGKTRAYLLAMLTQNLLWMAISSASLRPLGTAAIAMGYALSSLAWPVLMYPMVRHWFGVRINGEGVLLSGVALVAIVGAILLPTLPGLLMAALVPATVYLVGWDRRKRQTAHA
jgi:PST family polysaccharide transporter